MDFIDLLTWKFLLLVVLATVGSLLVRINDEPRTKYANVQEALEDVATKMFAAILIAWASVEAGTDIYSFYGFILVTAGAVGGISTISAFIGKAQALLATKDTTNAAVK
jgi:fluoride ion exporter CrcB/FEX